jgi:hypothetical protein
MTTVHAKSDVEDDPKRSTSGLLTIAVAAPAVLSALFLPIFHQVHRWNYPTGSLEGVDLTPFARRDELMLQGLTVALAVIVITTGIFATSWRSRLIVLFAGTVAAAVSWVAVFAALLAG